MQGRGGTARRRAPRAAVDSLLFGVEPHDPATLIGAVVVLVGTALLAHWVPLRRALAIDPATALRHD